MDGGYTTRDDGGVENGFENKAHLTTGGLGWSDAEVLEWRSSEL